MVATGVSIDGTREVLGTAVGDSESYEFWREFLASLRARGLAGVHLVISDAHAGLKAAVAQQFTGSSWQRCRVHFMRNMHTAVSAKHAPAVTAAVKTIFAHTDPADVAAQWDRVADTLAGSFPKVATMMAEAKTDVLAFTAFPQAHWQKIWSNNPIVIWSPAVGVVDVRHEASGSLVLLSGRGYLQPSRKQSLRRKSACYTGGFANLVG